MKIHTRGVEFIDYKGASPSDQLCSFTDVDGATLLIKTTTLIKMYEIVKFDLERRGAWDYVMNTLEKENRDERV